MLVAVKVCPRNGQRAVTATLGGEGMGRGLDWTLDEEGWKGWKTKGGTFCCDMFQQIGFTSALPSTKPGSGHVDATRHSS